MAGSSTARNTHRSGTRRSSKEREYWEQLWFGLLHKGACRCYGAHRGRRGAHQTALATKLMDDDIYIYDEKRLDCTRLWVDAYQGRILQPCLGVRDMIRPHAANDKDRKSTRLHSSH